MTPPVPSDTRTLIDELLEEQQQLTAVERFARRHEHDQLPAQARHYRDLIPLEKPRPGEQYAFVVDLDSCTGCKACVTACHSLNGLDDNETWRTVGLLHGGSEAEPFQQTVTSACHHCVDPACLNGCPVLAYEKDPHTGIVRHLDDQCIGCQYCVLKCPYDVPKYSARRGIVRKCDLCHGRLAAGEAPACVQACPSSAIAIHVVAQETVARHCDVPGERLLPGTVESNYTRPATAYRSRRQAPANVRPADEDVRSLEPAHLPLVWMLVLTQLAAGLFIGSWLIGMIDPQTFVAAKSALALAANFALWCGLAASLFHLGRPLGAWRAFLGWRKSWMSREIIAFGLFAAIAAAFAGVPASSGTAIALAGMSGLAGFVAVFCSAMIYIDTRRPFWRASSTIPKFFGTALLLAATDIAALLASPGLARPGITSVAHAATWTALLVRTLLFIWEASLFARGLQRPETPDASALLTWRYLRPVIYSRTALFVIATGCGWIALTSPGVAAANGAVIAFVATFASQWLERYCFFRTVVAPRMPGGVAP
jgi:formate dehydrogenase iron-sulfur subunit